MLYRRAAGGAAVLALALASACSSVFITKSPPEPVPREWPECTEHRLHPFIDGAVTAVAVAVTAIALTSDDDVRRLSVMITVPMAIVLGRSMVKGLRQTARCRRARAAYLAAVRQERDAASNPATSK